MKNISILLPFGNHAISIASTITILDIAQRMNCSLEYQLVAPRSKRLVDMKPFKLKADATIAEITSTDLIIISPIVAGAQQEVLTQNQPLIDWVKAQYEAGAEVVSLCTGAYILAATGLLAGKEASSHFSAIKDLQKRFPEVLWRKEKIITEQERLITSGGALSSLNALIYWLLKYYDKRRIMTIAKNLQLEYPRASQKPFYIFANQKNHQDALVLKVQEYMEQHQGGLLNFDALAEKHHISRRSLNRRFRNATGESLRSYQQRILVERAKEYLENQTITIQELAYALGYVDVNSFRNLFHKVTGTLPYEYQKKFQSTLSTQ